jgi:glycosyltransferase involved in cell wall biosynthesis
MRAVRSALREIDGDDEIIIVDDGSTDGTKKVLEPHLDSLKYIRIEHSGAGASRNRGIREATKPLVAFLDSDDEWMPGKLALHKRFMQTRPDVLFTFTDFAVKEESGRIRRHCLQEWHRDARSWNEILGEGVFYSEYSPLPQGFNDFYVHAGSMYFPMILACYIATFTLVVRREEASNALFFEEDVSLYEDWSCFARLARTGLAAYLDVETAWNHGHTGKRLTDASPLVQADTRLTILQRVWGSDPSFLEQYKAVYEKLVNEQCRLRVISLIADGRTKEARSELANFRDLSVHHRLLAMLPGRLARFIVTVRRRLTPDYSS